MSVCAVVGASGTVGRHIVAALPGEVRALHRSSAAHPVDLTTGEGLPDALAGCDVVVDASNGPSRRPRAVLVDGARRLVDAAQRAGVRHLVLVSVVGIDEVPMGYYRAKVAQEQLVRAGGVPWTIVRSTQFHELLDGTLAAAARWRLSPRSQARVQPVAAAEAAAVVAAVARGEPLGAVVTVAGPEIRPLTELARIWSTARGRRLVPLSVPLGGAVRAGALTCATPDHRGTTTFARWLS